MRFSAEPERAAGFESLPAGKYHVSVVHVQDVLASPESTIFTFRALAGTNPDGVNLFHRERILWYPQSDKAAEMNQRQLATLAVELGAHVGNAGPATFEKLQSLHRAGTDITFNWEPCKNKHLVIEIRAFERKDKNDNPVVYHNLSHGGIWQPRDPGHGCPLNEQELSLAEADETF